MIKIKVNLDQNKPKLVFFNPDKVNKNYNVSIFDKNFKAINSDIIEVYEKDYIVLRSFETISVFINVS